MLYLLAGIAPTDPQTHIQASVSGGYWQPAAVIVAALIAAFAGQYIAHWLNDQRDRKQKVRNGYADLAAAIFNMIDIQKLRARINRDLNMTSLKDDRTTVRAELINQMRSEVNDLMEKSDDMMQKARTARCLLVMLLGKRTEEILGIDEMMERIETQKPRTVARTERMPSDKPENKTPNNDVAAIVLVYLDERTRLLNMAYDLDDWLRTAGTRWR